MVIICYLGSPKGVGVYPLALYLMTGWLVALPATPRRRPAEGRPLEHIGIDGGVVTAGQFSVCNTYDKTNGKRHSTAQTRLLTQRTHSSVVAYYGGHTVSKRPTKVVQCKDGRAGSAARRSCRR